MMRSQSTSYMCKKLKEKIDVQIVFIDIIDNKEPKKLINK